MDTFDVEPTARWVPYYSPVAPIEHDSDHAHDMYAAIPVAATTFKVQAPVVREDLIAAAGDRIGQVIRDLYDGVAFWDKHDTKGLAYHVFSHEGDQLRSYTAADVQYAVTFMKRCGVPVGKLEDADAGHGHPGLTFAWQGWFDWSKK